MPKHSGYQGKMSKTGKKNFFSKILFSKEFLTNL